MTAKITDQQLRLCARQGMSAHEVAELFGMAVCTVSRRAQNLGVELRDARNVVTVTDDDILDLLRRGVSKAEAARKLGVSPALVHKRLDAIGAFGHPPPYWTKQQVRDYRTLRAADFSAEEAREIVERPRKKIRAVPKGMVA